MLSPIGNGCVLASLQRLLRVLGAPRARIRVMQLPVHSIAANARPESQTHLGRGPGHRHKCPAARRLNTGKSQLPEPFRDLRQVGLAQPEPAGELFRRQPLVVLRARWVLQPLQEPVEIRLLRIRHFEMQCDPRQQK